MKNLLRLLVISLFLTTSSGWTAPTQATDTEKKMDSVQTQKEMGNTPQATESELNTTPTDEFAEDRPQPPTYEGAFLKMILVLLLLLFVIFFGIWVVRRLSRSRLHMFKEPKHIRIIDRRPLSAKTALYLIEIGNKRVLVAESQLEVKGLATTELTDPSQEE